MREPIDEDITPTLIEGLSTQINRAGYYYLGSACTDKPSDSACFCWATIHPNDNTTVGLIAIEVNTQKMFTRKGDRGEWSDWEENVSKSIMEENDKMMWCATTEFKGVEHTLDCNDYTEPGVSDVLIAPNNIGETVLNGPNFIIGSFYLMNICWKELDGGSSLTQFAIPYYNTECGIGIRRKYHESTWSEWSQLSTKGESLRAAKSDTSGNQDLNEVMEIGFNQTLFKKNTKNSPPFSDTEYFYLIVARYYEGNWVTTFSGKQIAVGYTSNEIYERYCYNDSWSDWERLVTKSDLKWKLIGTVTGSNSVTINKGNYNEYLVVQKYMTSTFRHLILDEDLSTTYETSEVGAYQNNSLGAKFIVRYRNNLIENYLAYNNAGNVLENVRMNVYAR